MTGLGVHVGIDNADSVLAGRSGITLVTLVAFVALFAVRADNPSGVNSLSVRKHNDQVPVGIDRSTDNADVNVDAVTLFDKQSGNLVAGRK